MRSMRLVVVLRALLALAALAVIVVAADSRAVPADPAARGLDAFLHAPTAVAPGAAVELMVETFGFATVAEARPLAGAAVEAGWDPESLGGLTAPPSVAETTDAAGRAHLSIPMPFGPPRELALLVAMRHGVHARVRKIEVERSLPAYVELHTADARVVPSSTISAWGRVASVGGTPIAGAAVVVSLHEGGVARHSQRLVTDRGGIVMARVPIPRVDEPVWEWTLRAEAETTHAGAAEIHLTPREETPGMPTLEAAWDAPASGALAGDRVPFAIRVHDATGQPLVDHGVRYWIGPKGTTPPSTDDEWQRHGTIARTDGAGAVRATRDMPTLVKSSGSSMRLVATTVAFGHALHAQREVPIGVGTATADLTPEGGAIVPGLPQRMLLRVRDGRRAGVPATFKASGDGLAATVTTDANGEAEITWNVPRAVGATRNVGPCAGGVAAAVAVRPTEKVAALANQVEGFTLCVSVDRDADGILRVEPGVARPGERVKVTVHRAPRDGERALGKRAYSAVAASNKQAQATTGWLDVAPDATATGELVLPDDASSGVWTVSAALPEAARKSRVIATSLLVAPKTLPLLIAKRAGGRAAPGGTVDVEAQLTDGHGHGLAGSVSAVVVDAFGGGDARVTSLDARSRLCGELGAPASRCTAFLEGEPSTAPLRRALASRRATAIVRPTNDPGEHATEAMRRAFADVVRSLEGAVFEATHSAQTLIDVRRREGGRWVFNPELFTLTTDAMTEPPTTPGGEPLMLADLAAVDPQVTFDNVARRVTRLKLFRVLAAVRDVRTNRQLDPNEPVFKDPNALLRRLVREGGMTEDMLLDPWGGTVQFVRTSAAPVPFLSVVHGFELRSPGPDGVLGNADDVGDPFARVLRSGSPYATAVEEDRLVDSKWDMAVSDETVRTWRTLFESLTGTALGGEGLGLNGVGEGGGGSGNGIGLGSVGTLGHGRGSGAISTGDAFWTSPVRTDGEGRVRLAIPLGDVETTWRIALVGVPDGLEPASTTIDVASEAPLSARVEAGATWIAGDVVEASITVRNRTAKPVRASVDVAAGGGAALERSAGPATIEIPANGARQTRARVSAREIGEASLLVTTRAPGLPDDVLRHTVQIVPPGERRVLTQTAWVEGRKVLGVTLDSGYSLYGAPRLVLERGYDDAIAAALDALEPERQTSTLGLVDALEAAIRIERWATARSTPRHRALAEMARAAGARALGRHAVYQHLDEAARGPKARGLWTTAMRVSGLTKSPVRAAPKDEADPTCPPAGEDALDAEPSPSSSVLPCWGAYVSNAIRLLENSEDPAALAGAVLALAERPHRAAATALLANRLRRIVKLQPGGDVSGPDARPTRATVYAALLRAQPFGASGATPDTLFAKLAKLRDVSGGYGSSSATLAVVRALLVSQLAGHGATRAVVRARGAPEQKVSVAADGFVTVQLPKDVADVTVETEGPGLIARLERPVLRSWTRPPPVQESPVNVEVVWPTEARAGDTGTLRVMLKQDRDEKAEVDVRIPLPPGVTLAAPTKGLRQLQGVLAFRDTVGAGGALFEAPIRFGLGGTFLVPEATARLARREAADAVAPSRTLLIRGADAPDVSRGP